MELRKWVLCILTFLISSQVSSLAAAQTPNMPQEMVDHFGKAAHGLMYGAKLSDGKPIGKERADALEYPLIPYDDIKKAIIRGHVSGFAAHCKLDWGRRSYMPFMTYMRKEHQDWTDVQFAYLGTLHGVVMGDTERWAAANQKCSEKFIKGLERDMLPESKE